MLFFYLSFKCKLLLLLIIIIFYFIYTSFIMAFYFLFKKSICPVEVKVIH